jgi:hypothetical protein
MRLPDPWWIKPAPAPVSTPMQPWRWRSLALTVEETRAARGQ